MEPILEYLQSLNPALLIPLLGFVVFLIVKILSLLGFLTDGTGKRIGVIVGTFVTAEMFADAEKAIGGLLVALISVAMNELVSWAGKKISGSD